MKFALALLVSDGYFVFSEYLKLSLIGVIFLVTSLILKEKIPIRLIIVFAVFLLVGVVSCLITESYINVRYLISQTGLLLACFSIYHLSQKGRLRISQIETFAKLFVVASLINYGGVVVLGFDLFDNMLNSFAKPSTSRYSLETVFGYRIQRLYFLSSEPSTHAITVFIFYFILESSKRLTTLWKLMFFGSAVFTFSLTGLLLFAGHYLLNRNLGFSVVMAFIAFVSLLNGIDQFSTLVKFLQLSSDPRIQQFAYAQDLIHLYPVSLEVINSQEQLILSLWLLVLVANGYVIGSAFLALPLFAKSGVENKAWFFLIFLVVPISYFLAASLLWWKSSNEAAHTI